MPGESIDAQAALLTADGPGAIGVIRVWGNDAILIADRLFRPARGMCLAETPSGRLRVGRAGAGIGDEVVAVVIDGEPPAVEIQSHAGAGARLVIESLSQLGARIVGPQETTIGASRYEHILTDALSRAPTLRVASLLVEQRPDAVRRELEWIADRMASENSEGAQSLASLIQRSKIGERLMEGWRIVLTGRPNVGKSRLMNALAGYERAIVAAEAGTTRDIVTIRTALDGWPVEIVDTAGLRRPQTDLEAAGIDLTRAQVDAADVVILLLDRSEPLTVGDHEVLDRYPHALRVANKSDLSAAWEPDLLDALSVSAATGEGMDVLIDAVAKRLVPQSLAPTDIVPIDPEMIVGLNHVANALELGSREAAILLLRSMINDLEKAEQEGPAH